MYPKFGEHRIQIGDEPITVATKFGHATVAAFLANSSEGKLKKPRKLKPLMKLKEKDGKQNSKAPEKMYDAVVCIKKDDGRALWQLLPYLFPTVPLPEVDCPPLLYAGSLGAVDCMEHMLYFGWSANVINTLQGQTVFMCAAEAGHVNILRLLLSWAPDDPIIERDGPLSLHLACRKGHLRVVRFLVANGVDLNWQASNRRVALHEAILRGHFNIAEYLIRSGSGVFACDQDKNTPLHLVIKALRGVINEKNILESGKPKKQQEALLNLVHLLIDAGANPFLANSKNKRPLLMLENLGLLNRVGVLHSVHKYESTKELFFVEQELSRLPPYLSLKIHFSSMTKLVVSKNTLSSLPDCLATYESLTYLDASHNQLRSIDPLVGIPHLEYLDLSHNSIHFLSPGIQKLGGLEFLSLAHNLLYTIPPEIKHLVHLKKLNIGHNLIETFPKEIACLAKLESFVMRPNPLHYLPHQVQSLSSLDVIQFYADLNRTSPWNNARLIVSGEPGVGKTSFINGLMSVWPLPKEKKEKGSMIGIRSSHDKGEREEESMQCKNRVTMLMDRTKSPRSSLDLRTWVLPPPPEGGSSIKKERTNFSDPYIFQIWEMPRLDSFMTRPFNSNKTIYVFVLDTRSPDYCSFASWLRGVREVSRLSHLLVLGSHIDYFSEDQFRSVYDSMSSSLQEICGCSVSLVLMNSLESSSISSGIEALRSVITKCKWYGEKVSRRTALVYQELMRIKLESRVISIKQSSFFFFSFFSFFFLIIFIHSNQMYSRRENQKPI